MSEDGDSDPGEGVEDDEARFEDLLDEIEVASDAPDAGPAEQADGPPADEPGTDHARSTGGAEMGDDAGLDSNSEEEPTPLPDSVDQTDSSTSDELRDLADSIAGEKSFDEEDLDNIAEDSFSDLIDRIEERDTTTTVEDEHAATHDITALPRIGKANSILLVSAVGSDYDNDACLSAFGLDSIPETRILFAAVTSGKPSRVSLFRHRYDEDPAAVAWFRMGRSGSKSRGSDERIINIRDLGDLKHLGISISKVLTEWEQSRDAIHVCFHTLTELVRHVEEERAFRFFHVLIGRIEEAGGTVHVHMDADAHEPETISLFAELFDATVEVSADDVAYRSRP